MAEPAHVLDARGRPLGQLRISVTDRCNLRCQYCMPEEEYNWLSRAALLTFDEYARLAGVFVGLGVAKVRLTGGEPLLRQGLPELVRALADLPGVADLALTTNGVLLRRHAAALRAAGLDRLTVSLDTLRADRFRALARRGGHDAVIDGIRAAAEAGFTGTKIDTVVMRGTNEDELAALIGFGRAAGAEVRFIEYMDVGGATHWRQDLVVGRAAMLAALTSAFGPVTELPKHDRAPADRFALPDGTVFGIISSTTEPFCATCDRSRLTADGTWYRCLYATSGTDLRGPLRDGASTAELAGIVTRIWGERADRGAVDRLGQRDRVPFVSLQTLKDDPRLEMHTRGG
ncbi:GTP 3',8-cyclase MoaA [Actinomadura graeca]|uniref:GTP 3',8-cyclase n=1 Tax=Actinomadura graeca TaxID=2750812 RepID=A0ABX8QU85_9ACTN|nr:GTP 3',8-cyclase MoaA [Actinomadura graeca]QXJ22307.1 GTP 3',8-cyclase MoaA [Actinomadura graeca]